MYSGNHLLAINILRIFLANTQICYYANYVTYKMHPTAEAQLRGSSKALGRHET